MLSPHLSLVDSIHQQCCTHGVTAGLAKVREAEAGQKSETGVLQGDMSGYVLLEQPHYCMCTIQ